MAAATAPVHVDVIHLGSASQLDDIAIRSTFRLLCTEGKGLLHRAAPQINGSHRFRLRLPQLVQQVIEGEPGIPALHRACAIASMGAAMCFMSHSQAVLWRIDTAKGPNFLAG